MTASSYCSPDILTKRFDHSFDSSDLNDRISSLMGPAASELLLEGDDTLQPTPHLGHTCPVSFLGTKIQNLPKMSAKNHFYLWGDPPQNFRRGVWC